MEVKIKNNTFHFSNLSFLSTSSKIYLQFKCFTPMGFNILEGFDHFKNPKIAFKIRIQAHWITCRLTWYKCDESLSQIHHMPNCSTEQTHIKTMSISNTNITFSNDQNILYLERSHFNQLRSFQIHNCSLRMAQADVKSTSHKWEKCYTLEFKLAVIDYAKLHSN